MLWPKIYESSPGCPFLLWVFLMDRLLSMGRGLSSSIHVSNNMYNDILVLLTVQSIHSWTKYSPCQRHQWGPSLEPWCSGMTMMYTDVGGHSERKAHSDSMMLNVEKAMLSRRWRSLSFRCHTSLYSMFSCHRWFPVRDAFLRCAVFCFVSPLIGYCTWFSL